MIDIQALKNAASGKWYGIFDALGVEVSTDPKKHTACPICGPGNNFHRFRVSNVHGNGNFICTQCGSGDGIALVQMALGLPFIEAVERINSVIGRVEECKADDQPTKDLRPILNSIWQSGKKYQGSPAEQYLRSRKITIVPQNIRYCPTCYEAISKQKIPAMVAIFTGKDGKAVGIQRNYMDGIKKAEIEDCKRMLSVAKLAGGAIRLMNPVDGKIGIAEGIESALSCWHLFGIPTWAATTASLLEAFDPPEGIETVIVFGDADKGFKGQSSAYRLANKLYYRGFKDHVDVQLPGLWGDFNDVLIIEGPSF